MRYLNKSFSLPAGSTKITQEQWDEIFGKKEDPKPELGTVSYAMQEELEEEE